MLKPIFVALILTGFFEAIITFFKEVNGSTKNLLNLYKEFLALRRRELELKAAKAPERALRKVVQEQIRKYDGILEMYEVFEMDVDINGERVKKIAKAIKEKAAEMAVEKKLLEKMETPKWTFDW